MDDTKIHGPAADAPTVSGEYARCVVCKSQWQIRADSEKEGCALCGADETAVTIIREDDD